MSEFVNVISNVGFPIACCVGMGIYIYKVQTNLVEIVTNNTKAIEKLIERIGKND